VDLVLFAGLLVLTGVVAGFVGSLAGLGGAAVMIPVLVIAFNVPFAEAAGTGMVTILATSSASGAAYVRNHLTDLRIGMFLEIATVPGALLGATFTVFLVHASLSNALEVALGALLLGLVPGTYARRHVELPSGGVPDASSTGLGLSGEYHDLTLGRDVPYAAGRTRPALAVMFGAGVTSGMFGIGGGVFKVLALERYLGLPMKVSTATSNFMIGVTAAGGAGVLLAAGYINPLLGAPAALGTAAGAYAGSRVLPGLRNQTVRLLFLAVMVALSVELILRGLGLP
jgi:uncharacterized protein